MRDWSSVKGVPLPGMTFGPSLRRMSTGAGVDHPGEVNSLVQFWGWLVAGWGWGSEVRLREHVEHTGVPVCWEEGQPRSRGPQSSVGLWRNQAKGSVQRLGAGKGENAPAEANVAAGGEGKPSWGESAKGRARGWPREAHLGGLPFLSPNSLLPSSFPASTVGGPLVPLGIK